jgi:hypothetical protein
MPAKLKAKPKPKVKRPAPPRDAARAEDLATKPCVTTADRLERIRELGRKIEEHVRFVARVETLPGTSAEARARAVAAFHDRLALLEGALARTLDELRLG